MIRTTLFAAGAALAAGAASAATVTYTSEADFLAAIGTATTQTEDFSGVNGTATREQLGASTTFATTGTVVSVAPPSADTVIVSDYLRLSIENSGMPADSFPNQTNSVTFSLPNATTFASLNFGLDGIQGIGNNSGTILSLGGSGDTIEFTNLPSPGFLGFFGFVSDTAFSSLTFSSAGLTTFNDDDFIVDDLQFAAVAPVPLPASVGFLAFAVAGLGALRRKRKS